MSNTTATAEFHLSDQDIVYDWVSFDQIMPDETLRELMAPIEPTEIDRSGHAACACFHSTRRESYEILSRVREWEKTEGKAIRAELAAAQQAEGEQRFHEYFKALVLDDFIEVPFIKTRKGQASEIGMWRVAP